MPVLPKTLQPPPVERPGNRQLDGAVHQMLTVGSQGDGAVAARVVEITDDVTAEWANLVERRRRRREAEQVRNESEYSLKKSKTSCLGESIMKAKRRYTLTSAGLEGGGGCLTTDPPFCPLHAPFLPSFALFPLPHYRFIPDPRRPL